MVKNEVEEPMRNIYQIEENQEGVHELPEELNQEYENESELIATSENPNWNNLILDTSVIASKGCYKWIKECSKVTVLHCVIREMDQLIKNNKKPYELKNSIRWYTEKMLKDKEQKFRLVPYRIHDTRPEADDIIIDYILEQPFNERPTLLTADKRLALKAKCCGIEYLVYSEHKEETVNFEEKYTIDQEQEQELKTEDSIEEFNVDEKSTCITKMGVKFTFNENGIGVERLNRGVKVLALLSSGCTVVNEPFIDYDVKYLVVVANIKKHNIIKASKIMMEDGKIIDEDYEYGYNEDFEKYEGDFDVTVFDIIKRLFIS